MKTFLHGARNRMFAASLLLAGGGSAVALGGCDDGDIPNPLCCNSSDFQVGGTITVAGESGVALQAVADIGGIASATVDDLTTACRAIAQDLGADTTDAEALDDKREKMQAYCTAAVSAIGTLKATAGGSISVTIEPPVCSANISAKANCQASCSAAGECDVQANPPTCEGGSLQVSCSGSCSAEGGAAVSCEGSCNGSCEGECTAMGGVECAGECEGTCEANGMAGSGIQADGSCQGTCMGTCKATPPGVTCTGSCNGSCTGSCEASAEVNVKCDGSCDGEVEPLKCEGGELKGGCEVDAKCEANCDASVKAKAECTPPSISIDISGAADLQAAGKLKAVLEANLGLIAAVEGRLTAVAEVMPTLVGNINAELLVDIKAACIPVVVAALANAADDVAVSVEASISVLDAAQG